MTQLRRLSQNNTSRIITGKNPSSMSKLLKLFNAENVKELRDLGEFIHFSLKIRQDLLKGGLDVDIIWKLMPHSPVSLSVRACRLYLLY